MKKLLPLLLICCLLLTSCGQAGGDAKDASDPGGAQSGASEAGTSENPPSEATQATPAEPFALYPAYMQLPLGQHVTLDADTAPAGKKLTWTSSDTSVATVDENGRITPVAEGEAIITASTADDVSITSTCGLLVIAEGNILLWEYEPEPEDLEAFRATMDARPDDGEEQAGEESP